MINRDMEQIAPDQPFKVSEVPENVIPNKDYKAFQFTIGDHPPFFVMVTKLAQPLHVASVVEEGSESISFALTPWGAIRGAIIKHLGGSDA